MEPSVPGAAALKDLIARIRSKRLVLFGDVLDAHHTGAPSPQATVDLFAKEWASRFPPPLADVRAGSVPLFEDERMSWAMECLEGISGMSVLELGPLEGGHTFMLERAGARSVVSVESNGRAFLKCLVVKELIGLERAHFVLGDAMEYLHSEGDTFDLCVANGILYHMPDPVALVEAISRRAQRLIMWTHYYDPQIARGNPRMRRKMRNSRPASHDGFRHTLYEHRYGLSLRSAGFCGGTQSTSSWLSREDLMGALEHYGWTEVKTAFEQADHPNGPALALVATKGSPPRAAGRD